MVANASYVTNSFVDSGLGTTNILVVFTPTSTPLLLTNGQTVYSNPVKATATNGILTPTWVGAGNYNVQFGPQHDVWQVSVPSDTNTYSLWQLATNINTTTNLAHLSGVTSIIGAGGIVVTASGSVYTIAGSGSGSVVNSATNKSGLSFSLALVTNIDGSITFSNTVVTNVITNSSIATLLSLTSIFYNGTHVPYCVSTNGDDTKDGLTWATAWQTMQHADITAASNSTVLLFGGQTFSNQFPVTMTNALTWCSYGSSQAVITSTNFLAHGIIQLQGSGIVISNLAFSGNTNYVTNYADPLNQGAGIYCGVGGASTMSFGNIQVVGCHFTNLTSGVMFRATNGTGSGVNLTFSNNSGGSLGEAGVMLSVSGRVPNQFPFTNVTITGNSISNVFGFPNLDSAFPVAVTGCTNLFITGNILHDSGQSQSGATGGAGGIVVVGSSGFDFSRNIVHDIWDVQPFGKDGIGIDADIASQNGAIHDNLSYHNHGAGYDFFSSWGNVSFYHNISAFNGIGFLQGTSPNEQNSEVLFKNSDLTDSTGITNFLVYSNILAGNTTAPLHFSDALSFGANFVSNNVLVTLAGNVISWDGINGTTFNTNDYWSVGNGTPEILWNNVTYDGIAAWQAATSQDPNARSENPYQYGMFVDWPDKDFFAIFDQLTGQYFYSPNQGPTVSQVNKRNILIAGGGNPAMTATNNVFISPTSGTSNTTGSFNFGGSPFSLFNNTIGSENYAPATSSLFSNVIGSHNSTSGPFDMNDNIDGSFDDVSGEFALMHGIHASNDVAHGYNSQLQGISNQFTTSSGENSAKSGTNLVHVVADGDNALYQLLNGTQDIAIGSSAGSNYIANESSNIVIGNLGVPGDFNVIRIGDRQTNLIWPPNLWMTISNLNVIGLIQVQGSNIYTLLPGANVTFTTNGNEMTISSSGGGGGPLNIATNNLNFALTNFNASAVTISNILTLTNSAAASLLQIAGASSTNVFNMNGNFVLSNGVVAAGISNGSIFGIAVNGTNYYFNGANSSSIGLIWSNGPGGQMVLAASPTGGGGGQNQTPLLSVINGNGFGFTNITNITIGTSSTTASNVLGSNYIAFWLNGTVQAGISNGVFQGNGSLLTALTAANLSGTIPATSLQFATNNINLMVTNVFFATNNLNLVLTNLASIQIPTNNLNTALTNANASASSFANSLTFSNNAVSALIQVAGVSVTNIFNTNGEFVWLAGAAVSGISNANVFGNGSLLTSITGGNISGTIPSASLQFSTNNLNLVITNLQFSTNNLNLVVTNAFIADGITIRSNPSAGIWSVVSSNLTNLNAYRVYNVTNYGISANGSDCSVAISNLFTTISNNGGGTMYFPIGTYTVTGIIQVPLKTTGSGSTSFRITGEDKRKSILAFSPPASTNTVACIQSYGKGFVEIDNLFLDSVLGSNDIFIGGTVAKLHDLFFFEPVSGTTNIVLGGTNATYPGATTNMCFAGYGTTVRDCVSDGTCAVFVLAQANANGIVIEDNFDGGGTGLASIIFNGVASGTQANGNLIQGNSVEMNDGYTYGVWEDQSYDIQAVGNMYFDAPGGANVFYGANTYANYDHNVGGRAEVSDSSGGHNRSEWINSSSGQTGTNSFGIRSTLAFSNGIASNINSLVSLMIQGSNVYTLVPGGNMTFTTNGNALTLAAAGTGGSLNISTNNLNFAVTNLNAGALSFLNVLILSNNSVNLLAQIAGNATTNAWMTNGWFVLSNGIVNSSVSNGVFFGQGGGLTNFNLTNATVGTASWVWETDASGYTVLTNVLNIALSGNGFNLTNLNVTNGLGLTLSGAANGTASFAVQVPLPIAGVSSTNTIFTNGWQVLSNGVQVAALTNGNLTVQNLTVLNTLLVNLGITNGPLIVSGISSSNTVFTNGWQVLSNGVQVASVTNGNLNLSTSIEIQGSNIYTLVPGGNMMFTTNGNALTLAASGGGGALNISTNNLNTAITNLNAGLASMLNGWTWSNTAVANLLQLAGNATTNIFQTNGWFVLSNGVVNSSASNGSGYFQISMLISNSSLATTPFAIIGSNANYSQIYIQNTATNTNASSDIVFGWDNSSSPASPSNYFDIGVNSSNFIGFFGNAHDAYIYNLGPANGQPDPANGANIRIGTANTNSVVSINVAQGTNSTTPQYIFTGSNVAFAGYMTLGGVASSNILQTNGFYLLSNGVVTAGVSNGVFFGNGTNLTNIPFASVNGLSSIASTITTTNFLMNQYYTNTSGSVQFLIGEVTNQVAAAAGDASILIAVSNAGYASWSNYVIGPGSTVLSIAMNYSNIFNVAVGTNGMYAFTNNSTGTGNAAGIVPGTGVIVTIGNATASGVGALGGNNVWTGNQTYSFANGSNVVISSSGIAVNGGSSTIADSSGTNKNFGSSNNTTLFIPTSSSAAGWPIVITGTDIRNASNIYQSFEFDGYTANSGTLNGPSNTWYMTVGAGTSLVEHIVLQIAGAATAGEKAGGGSEFGISFVVTNGNTIGAVQGANTIIGGSPSIGSASASSSGWSVGVATGNSSFIPSHVSGRGTIHITY